ncbi:unnamed protein product, partial [Polarella glacialis]
MEGRDAESSKSSKTSGRFACPNGCPEGACPAAKALGVAWAPAEHIRAEQASQAGPLELSLSGEPFLVEGSSRGGVAHLWGWRVADGRWASAQYLRDHVHTERRRSDEDAAVGGYRAWKRSSCSVLSGHAALKELCRRQEARHLQEASAATEDEHFYLTAWEYDPPDCGESSEDDPHSPPRDRAPSARLSEDVDGGARSLPCLFGTSEQPALQAFSKLLRWIYVGEEGSACDSHVDPVGSHAWMWLAAGEKSWRMLLPPAERKDPVPEH